MPSDTVIILVLLGACLIALILVMIARKEAEAVRDQARLDTRDLHDRLKRLSDDLDRREARLEGRTVAADGREHILSERAEELSAQRVAIEPQLAELERTQAAVSTIELPNDEYRGRVIGKEGRNINTFMALTGVDVLLDDDSLLLVLSSFDTQRREIAVAAMEELLADGCIQPDRIEAAVQRATETVGHRNFQRAEKAAQEAGIVGLNDDVLALLGSLSTQTSYGQIIREQRVSRGPRDS